MNAGLQPFSLFSARHSVQLHYNRENLLGTIKYTARSDCCYISKSDMRTGCMERTLSDGAAGGLGGPDKVVAGGPVVLKSILGRNVRE